MVKKIRKNNPINKIKFISKLFNETIPTIIKLLAAASIMSKIKYPKVDVM